MFVPGGRTRRCTALCPCLAWPSKFSSAPHFNKTTSTLWEDDTKSRGRKSNLVTQQHNIYFFLNVCISLIWHDKTHAELYKNMGEIRKLISFSLLPSALQIVGTCLMPMVNVTSKNAYVFFLLFSSLCDALEFIIFFQSLLS